MDADANGRPAMTELPEDEIDEGILGVVKVLHAAGVETFSSCQGGGPAFAHAYIWPTVSFYGDDAEGERAEKIATGAGFLVRRVNRVWFTRDGERFGPTWEMQFVSGAAWIAPALATDCKETT